MQFPWYVLPTYIRVRTDQGERLLKWNVWNTCERNILVRILNSPFAPLLSPDIHVPLRFLGLSLSSWSTSSDATRLPLILGPGSGGVIMTTARATRPITAPMTSRAMAMPFQLRWDGVAATSSWKQEKTCYNFTIAWKNERYNFLHCF